MRNPAPPPVARAAALFARLQRALGFGPVENAGVRGERAAEKFLRDARGFTFVARNWRNPRDRREELDLVMRDGEVLVFIEVKTRSAHALVSGYHAVNARKKAILLRAIRAYLGGLKPKPRTVRFDIVEVELPAAGEGAPEVRHHENVALFPKRFQP